MTTQISTPISVSDPPLPVPWPGANRRLLQGGAPIQPLIRVGAFSPEEFENFVLEWVHGFLAKKYNSVQMLEYNEIKKVGGAGDKGRDIIAWIDPPNTADRKWDNYQCKHYEAALTPTEFYVELGKLCYYSYKKDYSIPRFYYIVTHKGVGPKLSDLLNEPVELRKQLISNWDNYCKERITNHSVPLEGRFARYVEAFDFSIIREVPPMTLIEQHSYTRYHALIFGTALKPRPQSQVPPPEVDVSETRYVEQIYEAFSDHLKAPIKDPSGFAHRIDMKNNFHKARVSFYCAESLKEFSRDSLPDDEYFVDLKEQILEGISITVDKLHADGYARLVETTEKAVTVQIDSNPLKDALRPNDRIGICHHLANEDKLRWVPND